MQDINNADVPSSSPHEPKVAATYVVDFLRVLEEVNEKTCKLISGIAENLFEHLIECPDEEVLNGTLKNIGDERVDKYIPPLNRLFKLVKRSGMGVVQLSANTVKALDKKTAALVNCTSDGDDKYAIGGVPLLELLCDIVNEELLARVPHSSPSHYSAKPAFATRQHPHPIEVN